MCSLTDLFFKSVYDVQEVHEVISTHLTKMIRSFGKL